MRIQPRRQILDIWRALAKASYQDEKWKWQDANTSNSISDAEQLLCLLYPATEVPKLTLDEPDRIERDVAAALKPLGEPRKIPYLIIDVLEDYLRRNTVAGEPHFGGKGYLSAEEDEPTPEQLALGMVDSYSMSVTLCLAAIGFLRVYKPPTRKPEVERRIVELEQNLSRRLTAAMVGLLRSFVVKTVSTKEKDAKFREGMLATVNQSQEHEDIVVKKLRIKLARVRARLIEGVRIGVTTDGNLEDEDDRLFEIGWSWGIVSTAPAVKLDLGQGPFTDQPAICSEQGVAEPRPYLYSTVLALDGINDLRSQRTLELSLLDDEQRRLTEMLRIRYDLTQRYWSTIARFGDVWPLEDMPWRTSDGEESDYFSLLVSAVLVQDLESRTADDDDLNRAVDVFESLAQRGRITRRFTEEDPAVALHTPGVRIRLVGSDSIGPPLYWHARDFSPLLLKRCLQAAALSSNRDARDRLLDIARATMLHLATRRIEVGPAAGLWDDPGQVLPGDGEPGTEQAPSWYLTERVIEALVTATRTYEGEPLRSQAMRTRAQESLQEAEQLYNRLLLETDTDDTSAHSARLDEIETMLTRAEQILTERPGTANSLGLEALRALDELLVARHDAVWRI